MMKIIANLKSNRHFTIYLILFCDLGLSLFWLKGQLGIKLSLTILAFLVVYLINKLVKNNLNQISDLNEQVLRIQSEVESLIKTSQELNTTIVDQTSSLQMATSAVEEINATVSANTENAKQSVSFTEETLAKTNRGQEVVQAMRSAISEINDSNNEVIEQIETTNKEIENIVKIINQIGTKTEVINEIVFQTKLLSFNASVEAARAGEAGKGFAVVAEEVGKLAVMSGGAATDISTMLNESIKTVERIVLNSRNKMSQLVLIGKEKVRSGISISEECSSVLTEINESVSSVSNMISSISSSTEEQKYGIEEVNRVLKDLDQVTNLNAKNSENLTQKLSSLI